MKGDRFLVRFLLFWIFCIFLFIPFSVNAALYSSNLDFVSTDQNMWGGGSSVVLSDTYTIGLDWNVSGSVGGFVGGQGTATIIPGGCLPWPLNSTCWAPVTIPYDTTTGASIGGATNGFIGIETGYALGGGLVNASYMSEVILTYPDPNTISPGDTFTISSQIVSPSVQFDTNSPEIEAYVDLIFDVYADLQASARVAGVGPDIDVTLIDIDETIELVGFNRDGNERLSVFGIDTGLIGEEVSLGPFADVTATIPHIETISSPTGTGTYESNGETNFLELGIDVDAIATTSLALPPLEGDVAGVLGFNILDIDVGAELDIVQSFLFDPLLQISLSTSYGNVFTFNAGDSIELEMGEDIMDIFPTFTLNNSFTNLTGLSIVPEIELSALEAYAFGLQFGPLYENQLQFDVFPTIPVYNNSFALEFASFTGTNFSILPGQGQGSGQEPVPEPATFLLLGVGLVSLAGYARQKKHIKY